MTTMTIDTDLLQMLKEAIISFENKGKVVPALRMRKRMVEHGLFLNREGWVPLEQAEKGSLNPWGGPVEVHYRRNFYEVVYPYYDDHGLAYQTLGVGKTQEESLNRSLVD